MSMQRRHRLVRIAAAAAVAGGLVASVGIAPAGSAKPKPLAAATINAKARPAPINRPFLGNAGLAGGVAASTKEACAIWLFLI